MLKIKMSINDLIKFLFMFKSDQYFKYIEKIYSLSFSLNYIFISTWNL